MEIIAIPEQLRKVLRDADSTGISPNAAADSTPPAPMNMSLGAVCRPAIKDWIISTESIAIPDKARAMTILRVALAAGTCRTRKKYNKAAAGK